MKNILTIIFILLVCPVFSQVTVVVLGSSTAEGIGPSHPDSAWVNRYRTYLQEADPINEVINLARGGYTTYHILPTGTITPDGRPNPDPEKNVSAALAENPDAIIINLPSNDAAGGYTVLEQLENYDAVLAQTDALSIPVWIATTQPRNLNADGIQGLRDMRDSTNARYGDKAIDFWSNIAFPTGHINPIYNSGDNVHLNDAAHKILFERVAGKNIPEQVITNLSVIEEATNSITVYPNPARDVVYLNFNNGLENDLVLQIKNAMGKVLQTHKISSSTKSEKLNISYLPNGIYWFQYSNQNQFQSHLLIKQ